MLLGFQNHTDGLVPFLGAVAHRVDGLIARHSFDPEQRRLLHATVAMYRSRSCANPLGDPLALFHLVTRAERRALDRMGVDLAAFCQFYVLALDLFDDVQDDDLSGKPHEQAGAAVAINTALTLLFLGLSSLEEAMRSEPNVDLSYLALVNRVALITSRGQYRDLTSRPSQCTPVQVLEMHREKTASLALLCECAAYYATRDSTVVDAYRRIGENLSLLVQVVDDVRDIYGKKESPDLIGDKPTYPLACFFQIASADQISHFEKLRSSQPQSSREIRALLCDMGVIQAVARQVETFRRSIHRELAARCKQQSGSHMLRSHAAYRTMLFAVDGFVRSVYVPPPILETQSLFAPSSAWHERVRELAREFRCRMASLGAPETPPLIPWHLGQWMYDADRNLIFYPDLDGMPEDALGFQAELLGASDVGQIRAQVEAQAPAILAHELFHHFRRVTGRLTKNHWQEELAANALAVAYCRQYEPAALAGGLAFAHRVLARPENQLPPNGQTIVGELLAREADEVTFPAGYELGLREIALVQLAMIVGLADRSEPLDSMVRRMLTPLSTEVRAQPCGEMRV